MSIKMISSIILTLLSILVSIGAADVNAADVNDAGAHDHCTPSNGIEPYCTFNRPEDLALIPGTRFLIVSQIGGVEHKAGSLLLFDTVSKQQSLLYSQDSAIRDKGNSNTWGEKTCTVPTHFSPHGIDIGHRPDGQLELFVVNHGAKESMQLFSVSVRQDGAALQWRGCVEVEAGNLLNDVAPLSDGGFVTGSTIKNTDNSVKGALLLWRPTTGLSTVTTIDGAYLNGLAVSPDNATIFLNNDKDASVTRIDLRTGKITGLVKMPRTEIPDNSSWASDGRLLVASIGLSPSFNYVKCDKIEDSFCDMPFEIVAIDPISMQANTIFWHSGGPPFGQATVAIEVGGDLYLGSSTGDRIAKIKTPPRDVSIKGASAAVPNVVSVDGGAVSGVASDTPGVLVFKGLPYAAPPIGNLRWRAPLPVVPWKGVRPADSFGANCPQIAMRKNSLFYAGEQHSDKTSEDCLFLNVWTAAGSPKERRPVLLWIHDGGYMYGDGSKPVYNGEVLSKKGLVVVTFNYRLSVLAALAHPELSQESEHRVSGNYGMLDMIAAIQWTRRNIAAFGGDPDRISIYGESVGSRAVTALSVSPLVKGDIRGVIAGDTLYSSAYAPIVSLAEAEHLGVGFVKTVGAKSISELRDIPPDDLIADYMKYQTQGGKWVEFIVDDWVLLEDAVSAEKDGTESKIPILTGTTANLVDSLFSPISLNKYLEVSRKSYGPLADRFLSLYPPGDSDATATAADFSSMADKATFMHHQWAQAHTRSGNRAYVYYFTAPVPIPPGAELNFFNTPLPKKIGAYHTGEIAYAFDSLAKLNPPWTPADYRLADIMSSYWVNFVSTGDPNGPGLPKWPVYGEGAEPVMELGDPVRAIPPVLSKAKIDFWTEQLSGPSGTQ
jgi:para-nitrobenzyl esterase